MTETPPPEKVPLPPLKDLALSEPELAPPSNPSAALDPVARRRAAWVTFLVLLIASFAGMICVFGGLWKPLFFAAVLASSLSRWHEKLARRLKNRRALSSATFTIGVVLLLLIPLTAIVLVAVREALGGIDFVRTTLAAGGIEQLIDVLPSPLDVWTDRMLEQFPIEGGDLSSRLTATGGIAVSAVSTALSETSTLTFNLVMMLIAFNFLLSDGHKLAHWIKQASPLRGNQTVEIFAEFRKVSHAVLGSTLATAAAQATVATIGYLIAGVPRPVFFGLLTFFTAFIPSVGTSIVALPLVGLVVLLGHPWKAVFLAVWSLFLVGIVDNLMKPLLMKSGMHLHGALVFLSLVGGVLWVGGPGLVLGPLAVTFFVAMVRLGKRDFT